MKLFSGDISIRARIYLVIISLVVCSLFSAILISYFHRIGMENFAQLNAAYTLQNKLSELELSCQGIVHKNIYDSREEIEVQTKVISGIFNSLEEGGKIIMQGE